MSLTKAEHDELCCVYAGLLLFDDGIDITADKIEKIIKASGNEVDGYYPEFFAKYLAKTDIKSMLTVTPAAGATAAPAEEKHEEKKDDKKGGKKDDKKSKKKEEEKPKEEEEDDIGFGDIFG
jgi:large subunit ribosomal protein LP1